MERRSSVGSAVALCLVTTVLCRVAFGQYAGGSGTAEDPYVIYTAEQMNAVGAEPNDWDKQFLLMADIDLSGYAGTEFNMIGASSAEPFSGTFDGNGHAISNLTLSSRVETGIGLFGCVNGARAEVRNLSLIGPAIGADNGGDFIGPLVGWLAAGAVRNCSAQNVSVTCRGNSGGLIGLNRGEVMGCFSGGQVSGRFSVGGLIGHDGGSVANCYSMADVTGIEHVGGLIGSAHGRVVNCYSTGTASGDDFVGGLAGSGSRIGIEDCFWDAEASGLTTSSGGLGRTTAQMQTLSTFVAWGRSDQGGTWTIDEGQDYPRLWWEDRPGVFIGPEGVLALLAGSGTADNPYLIHTAEEMNLIGTDTAHWDRHYKLMADIDLSGYTGDQFNRIGYHDPHSSWWDTRSEPTPFTGVFDGNGHTIANFSYASQDYERGPLALFCYVDDPNAEIKNLALADPNVGMGAGEYERVGALVGWLAKGTIAACYARGVNIAGYNEVGGLVGRNEAGTIRGCHINGVVAGAEQVGGLVACNGRDDSRGGDNRTGTITDCCADVSVRGERRVGGLVGCNERGDVADCRAAGVVSADYSTGGLVGQNGLENADDGHASITDCHVDDIVVMGDERVGGLVGCDHGTLTACHSSGTVVGANDVGGLVGYAYRGSVSGSFSLATVIGSEGVGGLAGFNASDVNDCYAKGSVVGETSVGGLAGRNYAGMWRSRARERASGATIRNCYATGTVWGTSHVGGLIGYNSGDAIQCFWDVETSGQVSSAGGVGGTTAQMQTAGTFVAWGRPEGEGVWTIDDGNDYPRLWWEDAAGTPIEPSRLLGAGTADDPFLIGTAQELASMAGLACDWDKHYRLTADIDLSAYTGIFGVIGTYDIPFTSVFDGDGHTVSNLHFVATPNLSDEGGSEHCAGLFGTVDDPNALISNLGLVDPCIDTQGYRAGALVRVLEAGTVSSCFAKGGFVTGMDIVGGLVGHTGGVILNCYANVQVEGENRVAGLAGINSGTIINSYSVGNVQGTHNTGGFVADQVRGRDMTTDLNALGCLWDVETSGQVDSAGGTGLTTSEMWDVDTYLEAGWDFVGEVENGVEDIWWIEDGAGYPRLWWELGAVDAGVGAAGL